MSKLEDSVVSLETAKKLVEAGIKVDSYFSWFYFDEIVASKGVQKVPVHWLIKDWARKDEEEGKCYPAPTFEELDLIDPIEKDGKIYRLKIGRTLNHYWVNYFNHYDQSDTLVDGDKLNPENDHKLADVAAEVLIELKKGGIYA